MLIESAYSFSQVVKSFCANVISILPTSRCYRIRYGRLVESFYLLDSGPTFFYENISMCNRCHFLFLLFRVVSDWTDNIWPKSTRGERERSCTQRFSQCVKETRSPHD